RQELERRFPSGSRTPAGTSAHPALLRCCPVPWRYNGSCRRPVRGTSTAWNRRLQDEQLLPVLGYVAVPPLQALVAALAPAGVNQGLTVPSILVVERPRATGMCDQQKRVLFGPREHAAADLEQLRIEPERVPNSSRE